MSDQLPELNPREIAQVLGEQLKKDRPRHLFAIYGTMPEAAKLRDLDYELVPVQSELELRERMPPLGENPKIAFLVPWNTELPLDLAGRFAKRQHILTIGGAARLKTLFGVREVEPQLEATPLAQYLLRQPNADGYSSSAGKLTSDTLWHVWLQAEWGVPNEGGLALDALLAWAAQDQRGPQFKSAMSHSDAAGVRDALLKYLNAQLGAAAAATWQAWERGEGATALEYALLAEALFDSDVPGARTWLALRLGEDLKLDDRVIDNAGEQLGFAAREATRLYGKEAGGAALHGLVRRADERVTRPEIRPGLERSHRLPAAWSQRLQALDACLERGAEKPAPEAVAEAVTARKRLEQHAWFAEREDEAVSGNVKRLEMAVRLLAWLAARPDRKLPEGRTPYSAVETLSQWYAEEGGYVDRARRIARGHADDSFGRGIEAVVTAADAARTELDRRFAQGLKAWVEAGQPASQVLPIDQAMHRIGASFLQGSDERRLLVLLFDGMAWAQATELLESLTERRPKWGPLNWHRNGKHRIGGGFYPPMLAALPTVTEVSRAAFFAGKPMKPGPTPVTGDDPKRWREHRDVRGYFDTKQTRDLLLRADAHALDGSASPEALSRVADPDQRIVAIVINAIDASLKGDNQQNVEWDVSKIRPLEALLDKALECDRAILMVSDHGHVPTDRMGSLGSADGAAARWRPYKQGDPVKAPQEMALTGKGVFAPRGADGVVVLTDDACRYRGSAQAGVHGGATLAEVVAPCVLIGCEGYAPAVVDTDRDLEPMPAYVPAWWTPSDSVVQPPAFPAAAAAAAPARPAKKKPKAPEAQLSLTGVAPEPEPAPPKPAAPAARVDDPTRTSPLASSELLEARASTKTLRDRTVRAVHYLIERGNVASADPFAAAMGIHGFRVEGFVRQLQEVLNVDEYQVLRFDTKQRQIHLHQDLLEQQFEVKL